MLLTIYDVIIQKTMFPRKSEEDFIIKFVNLRKDRSSRSQMFFKIGVLTNLKFRKFLRTPFLQNTSVGRFWKGFVKELA